MEKLPLKMHMLFILHQLKIFLMQSLFGINVFLPQKPWCFGDACTTSFQL